VRGTAEGARSGGTDEWVDEIVEFDVCMYAVLYCTVLYCILYVYCIDADGYTRGAQYCAMQRGGDRRARERKREPTDARVFGQRATRQDRQGRQTGQGRAGQGRAGQGRQAGDTRLNRQAVQLWPRNLQEGEDVFPVILPLPLHFTYTLTHHTDATRRTAPHRPHHSHLIVPCASRVFPPRPRPLPFRPPRRHRRR
jgi:hypothetical protein